MLMAFVGNDKSTIQIQIFDTFRMLEARINGNIDFWPFLSPSHLVSTLCLFVSVCIFLFHFVLFLGLAFIPIKNVNGNSSNTSHESILLCSQIFSSLDKWKPHTFRWKEINHHEEWNKKICQIRRKDKLLSAYYYSIV